MNINNYLNETEFATKKLFEAIYDDFRRVEALKKEIELETKIVSHEYNRAIALQMYAEDPDDVMLGVGMYWENYFNADKDLYHKNKKVIDLTALLAAREFSICTLSGHILEHAKKGLSFVYGQPKNWPPGRYIGTQPLSTVIIEARNQTTHIEEAIKEGKFKKEGIKLCFEKLAAEVNPLFRDYLVRDLAFEVIKEIGWMSYNAFRTDIESIV